MVSLPLELTADEARGLQNLLLLLLLTTQVRKGVDDDTEDQVQDDDDDNKVEEQVIHHTGWKQRLLHMHKNTRCKAESKRRHIWNWVQHNKLLSQIC